MKRKDFLKLSGGLALAGLANKNTFASLVQDEETKKLKAFGLQLYSLRDDLPKDTKGVLKQVAGFGYKQIEGYEGPKGLFWGMTNKEFKAYMDELGTTFVSSHCDINKDFEKKAAESAEIGMKYLICPSVNSQKTIDEYKKIANQFNNCGEICKKAGIRFAYHNHDHDFRNVDGKLAQDIFMENTDPAIVDFEMDIYWVVTAKHDPEEWLKKYKNRFRFCHVKDRIKGATERDASCDLGTGSIDYTKILKTAKQSGMKYYIVEQERYDGTTPLKAVETCADYMKKLSI